MLCPGSGTPQVTGGTGVAAKGAVGMALGEGGADPAPASLPATLPASLQTKPGAAGEGPWGAGAVRAQPPLQPAVPLTESRDSHNYWDYKERVIDLQPALCDQRPGGPPGPPLLL